MFRPLTTKCCSYEVDMLRVAVQTVDMAGTAPGREAFGHLLKEARDALRLTQEDLAQVMTVSTSTVGNWERGENMPAPDVVFRLEEVVGLPAGALSKHLGYVPLGAEGTGPLSLLECVENSTEVSEDDRETLLLIASRMVGKRGGVKATKRN